jgi:murein DD-endopeptidase MepM/ murein hydrolase activator NlpD
MTNPISKLAAERMARPAVRVTKRLVLVVALVIGLCLACVGGVATMLLGGLGGDQPAPAFAGGCGGTVLDPNGKLPEIADLTEDQVRNAAIIIQVGQQMKIPPRGWVIGIATALQESWLTNLPDLGTRNDHDSIGLFQQRPSQGWGTVEQLSDPAYQAKKFFEKLVRIGGWLSLPLTVAAQRVQISAFPNAYAKHEPRAASIVDILTGGGGRAVGAQAALRCVGAGEVAASGWTIPVRGPITSGFRTASRPGHNGVDIGVPKRTAVHAAAGGVVIVVRCNAHVGEAPYSCDRDGGLWVSGCGWYVEILHAGGVITRYCHMIERPSVIVGQTVAAGQTIGRSGSSGSSSGPHLHFEVHLRGDPSPAGAVNPIGFMAEVGASLTGQAA